ncbi:MAG: RluA family pseudouridine synthase [Tyzzerella sp.]|nr:RluA family pseudouridine synthase [Tyzzerella sp.]
MNLNILHEDDHIIVCYKPAGIPTQTKKLGEQDMVSLLKNHLKGGYVAVIHRLDQPVEGLLVFAKTPFAAKELNKGLQGAGFGKHYKAVLWGIPEQKKAVLEDYLVKDGRTNTSRVCEPSEKDAKKAVLSYEVIATGKDDCKDISLVKVKLDTGRHHQIRVQMANIGCPIWGDAKYNTMAVQDRRFRQIALCAYRLEFVHPKTKKQMEFEIEPKGEGFQMI